MEAFLSNIALLLFLSVFVLLVCARIRVPSIIGLFIVGVISGPYGLGLINDPDEINMLADIGAILLLFIIGLEFSIENILKFKKIFFIGGICQLLSTFIVMFILMKIMGNPNNVSAFFAMIVGLSSTAIVFKLLQEKSLVTSPLGNISTVILIFQDIMIVPMMFMIPLLSGGSSFKFDEIMFVLLKASLVIALIFILSRKFLPKLLFHIAMVRSRELFLLAIVCICLVIAILTSKVGLSLAFGAFIAGLLISESEYSGFAINNIMPFKDLFASFLFMSIGMMLNTSIFFIHFEKILLISLLIIFIKCVATFLVVYMLKYPIRIAIIVAIAISQVGEFSFILSRMGLDTGLMDIDNFQYFISASILTMASTPILFNMSFKFADLIYQKVHTFTDKSLIQVEKSEGLKNHIVVIGYGLTGRFIVDSAKLLKFPYVIIEMNPKTVREQLKKGENIIYGDATGVDTLNNANVKDAKVVVLAISDILATRDATKIIKTISNKAYLIVRTPYVSEVQILKESGADEVIPAEFETSLEILTRVLLKFLVPKNVADKIIEKLRADNYKMLRDASFSSLNFDDINVSLPELDIISYKIDNNWPFKNMTIKDIDFRNRFSITILAILRDNDIIINPSAYEKICLGDTIIIIGNKSCVRGFVDSF
ncbi:MAG: cation:proton antiporter [Deferribacterota bacterium]|nr:cation:proton antiporter [Deferribacterota bacterium]